jgi:outer membrane protein OmpA-like peptidoglycan-associated protein
MDDQEQFETNSPATRLLDALGRGDLNGLLLEFRPTTIVRTDDRSWSIQGEEEVLYWLEEAFERFPGLVFDSHARHIGYGQVIEEARVRDIGAPPPAVGEPGDAASDSDSGPDASEGVVAAGGGSLVLDRDFGKTEGTTLNMPVRVTVLHDDASVHEIIASYPRALLRAAMGLHVDPLDMAVSEIQSAFVAPSGSGFKTYQMGSKPHVDTEYAAALPVPLARVAQPEPQPEPEPEPEPEPVPIEEALKTSWTPPPFVPDEPDDDEEKGGRRRALLVVPLVMLLVAAIAAGTWWLGRDDNTATAGQTDPTPTQTTKKPTNKPTSPAATPTKTPNGQPTEKPDVTFQSDLAFGINSSKLSRAAKSAIADLADDIIAAELKGTIEVHGYTDNVGSNSYALVLSLDRAKAVKTYLRSSLGDYEITIKAFGHGEANPVASNKTEQGRAKNRRVEITLPDSQ